MMLLPPLWLEQSQWSCVSGPTALERPRCEEAHSAREGRPHGKPETVKRETEASHQLLQPCALSLRCHLNATAGEAPSQNCPTAIFQTLTPCGERREVRGDCCCFEPLHLGVISYTMNNLNRLQHVTGSWYTSLHMLQNPSPWTWYQSSYSLPFYCIFCTPAHQIYMQVPQLF